MQAVLGRGGDAGLVLAAEGIGVSSVVRARLAVRGGRATGGESTCGEAGGGNATADQSASGDPGQDSTAAVSCESGSESALTAFARSCTSSGVRSS
ncbi:hypothetical protein GCM10023350_07090 [Nocardioides endophyticus]|uniref:Uncharacterized protein n=1 Tax=Nocardioides endophyticus TaxID=1353775 RepID=A0ABP8YEF8_9ACTN